MAGRDNPKVVTQSGIRDLLDGFTATGVLAKAGYQEGDFVPLFTAGGNTADTTSSSTYSEVGTNRIKRYKLNMSELEPSGGSLAFAASIIDSDNFGDQIDMRIYDDENSALIAEAEAVDANNIDFIGPAEYSAENTSIDIQFRNNDNSTSVRILDACLHFGVII